MSEIVLNNKELEEVLLAELEATTNKSEIIVFNDDYNTFDWVIQCFMEVCDHTFDQSEQLSLLIHYTGKASVKAGSFESLKPMKDALVDRGLSAVIETYKDAQTSCWMAVFALNENSLVFPSPEMADESGLLAIGGRLDVDWVLKAYSIGVFPWYNEDDPIMWWSPDPRSVIVPGDLKVQKSMKVYFNQDRFQLKIDNDFEQVIDRCQNISRKDQYGTWITSDMKRVYTKLHKMGYAHSFETWENGYLVGGLYGLSLGKIFFGESMFSSVSNASKYALLSLSMILKAKGFMLLDCQIPNEHLENMGCVEMSRVEYVSILNKNKKKKSNIGNWGEMADAK